MLRRRAELLWRLRTTFQLHGYWEVETPNLSADTVVDSHLEPIHVDLPDGLTSSPRPMWLQTSPEFCMKRLLAAGADRIYQVTRAYRGGERGERHNPEFTIVEWYSVDQSPDEAMEFLGELAADLLKSRRPERLTYREAFLRHVGLDPHRAELADLERAAATHGVALPEGAAGDRDLLLTVLLDAMVEPQLGRGRPTILCDYPASQAALAKTRLDQGDHVAERFELYWEGLELANGYHELLDAAELAARITRENGRRVADGRPSLPPTSRLLAAMRHGLPPCCGVALGFDRLVMAATGARRIDEVIPFPVERA